MLGVAVRGGDAVRSEAAGTQRGRRYAVGPRVCGVAANCYIASCSVVQLFSSFCRLLGIEILLSCYYKSVLIRNICCPLVPDQYLHTVTPFAEPLQIIEYLVP